MQTRELIDQIARTPQSNILGLAVALTVLRLAVFPLLRRTAPHMRFGPYRVGRFFNEALDSLVYAAVLIFFVVRPFVFQTFVIPSGSMIPTLQISDYIGLNKAIYRYTEPQRFDIVVFTPPKRAVEPSQIDASGNINVNFIKRLIGLPGDLIELKAGQLYINGSRVEQPFVHYTRPVGPSETQFEDLSPEEQRNMTKASWKLVERSGQITPLNYDEYDVNSANPRGNMFEMPYSVARDYRVDDPAEGERLKNAPAQRIPAGMYLFMGDNRNGSFDGRAWGLVPRADIVGRADFVWFPLARIRSLH